MMTDTVTGNGKYAEDPQKTDADSQHIPQGTGPSKNRDTFKTSSKLSINWMLSLAFEGSFRFHPLFLTYLTLPKGLDFLTLLKGVSLDFQLRRNDSLDSNEAANEWEYGLD